MLNRSKFLIGQYRPGNSLLHRLDARTKIFLVLMVMVSALVRTEPVFYLVLILVLMSLLLSCGLGWRLIFGNLKPVAWFIAFTAIFHLLFSGGGDTDIVATFWFVSISKTALYMALVYSARILIFVLSTFILSLTTSPLSLSEAIVSLLKPLHWVKIPIYDLGMILFIALRFIPVLANEMDTIRKAQIIRGVDFGGSFAARIKKTAALVLPVFFSALRRADDLSIAIETRGYRGGQPRSSLYPLRFEGLDFVILGAAIIVLGSYLLGSFPWTVWNRI